MWVRCSSAPGVRPTACRRPIPTTKRLRATFGGALPPDSVADRQGACGSPRPVVHGRSVHVDAEAGPTIVQPLTGYVDAPHDVTCDGALQYNQAVHRRSCIVMPNPLAGRSMATYEDGTAGTVQNYAKDVAGS